MKRGRAIWILGGALAITACGAGSDAAGSGISNASAFEGIYQLTAASENTTGCDTPGASKLAQLRDQFFVVTSSEIFGQRYLTLNSCSSVADCQAKRAAQLAHQPYLVEYGFTLSSSTNATTLNGIAPSTGAGEGTLCVRRTYSDHVLTVAADRRLHLESRTKHLADQPQNDGFCEVDPAKSKQEAASKECSSLEVFDGSFIQAN
ncbi:MAG TPA: hypothetical protein VJV79_22715 [Polyangiaceae bacterium]|nr:hypothetical protein [Polyangiaceae bacterium]